MGGEFIVQGSLELSGRTLPEGQNYLFSDHKISGIVSWLIKVWISADTDGVSTSNFSSEKEEQKQV